jgi:hypothetical protein
MVDDNRKKVSEYLFIKKGGISKVVFVMPPHHVIWHLRKGVVSRVVVTRSPFCISTKYFGKFTQTEVLDDIRTKYLDRSHKLVDIFASYDSVVKLDTSSLE